MLGVGETNLGEGQPEHELTLTVIPLIHLKRMSAYC